MSRRRQTVLFRKYSELPSRYTRRVTRTSCQSTASSFAQSVKDSETSAKPTGSIDCKCMCRPQSRTLEVNIETFWGLQAKFAQFEVVGAATQHMILCLDQGSKPRIPPPKSLQNPKLQL